MTEPHIIGATRPPRPGLRDLLELAPVYRTLQSLVGADRARRRFVVEWLRPAPGARVLDVGCGPGDLVDHLPATVDYVGYDVNPRYVAAARRRHGGRGEFFCRATGDATEVLGERRFDLVVAAFLLHHLDDREVRRLIADARARLVPGGALVTIDPVRLPGQRPLARWLIRCDRGAHVRDAAGYAALAAAELPAVRQRVVHDLLRIPYDHLLLRAEEA